MGASQSLQSDRVTEGEHTSHVMRGSQELLAVQPSKLGCFWVLRLTTPELASVGSIPLFPQPLEPA